MVPLSDRMIQRFSARSIPVQAGTKHSVPSGSVQGDRPGGHEAFGAVGQRPGRPVAVTQGKAPAQLDGIDAEPLENVLIHDRQLLHDVVDANRNRRQAQKRSQLRIRQRSNSGRTMSRQVHGDAVGRAMVQGRQDSGS